MRKNGQNEKAVTPARAGVTIIAFLLVFFITMYLLKAMIPPAEIPFTENRRGQFINMYFPVIEKNQDNEETVALYSYFDYSKDEKAFADKTLIIPPEKIEEAERAVIKQLSSEQKGPATMELIESTEIKQLWEITTGTSVSRISFKFEATADTITPISYTQESVSSIIKFAAISFVISLFVVMLVIRIFRQKHV